MMEWVKVKTLYASEEKALKAANIIATTEARLASQPGGPQYEVETKIEPLNDSWQVIWRKVFVGYKSGCGGCSSCQEKPPETSQPTQQTKAKILPFRRKPK